MHFRFLQNQCTEFVKLPTIPVELSMVVTFTGPDSHLSLSGLISLICAIKALIVISNEFYCDRSKFHNEMLGCFRSCLSGKDGGNCPYGITIRLTTNNYRSL